MLTAAVGHPPLTSTTSSNWPASASSISGGVHWAACESPNSTTLVGAAGSPYRHGLGSLVDADGDAVVAVDLRPVTGRGGQRRSQVGRHVGGGQAGRQDLPGWTPAAPARSVPSSGGRSPVRRRRRWSTWRGRRRRRRRGARRDGATGASGDVGSSPVASTGAAATRSVSSAGTIALEVHPTTRAERTEGGAHRQAARRPDGEPRRVAHRVLDEAHGERGDADRSRGPRRAASAAAAARTGPRPAPAPASARGRWRRNGGRATAAAGSRRTLIGPAGGRRRRRRR